MTSRTIVGMVLVRPTGRLGSEPYFYELIAGMENVLIAAGATFVVHVVDDLEQELDVYRRWSTERSVDAVMLVDLMVNDQRPATLRELGTPTLVLGNPSVGEGCPTLWYDDDFAIALAVESIAARGHRSIARVSGPRTLLHTKTRSAAFQRECESRGISWSEREGDYSQRAGEMAARHIISSDDPPTAIVFDNDLMALGALTALTKLGVRIPGELSLVAWDDSPLCQLSDPSLSVIAQDVQRVGEIAAGVLLDYLGGAPARDVVTPFPAFVQRQTTAAPRTSDR
ncbi:LacI family DNA-binding transcriptional regulator [Dactylosporangium sp. CA-233914]|uniref:LacI family DNA-binding transcriptional regulator n=1 Tax=Dactylosporangium sp. CA-233914 TaxID=3239934 RepID=UPI003D8BDB8F